MADTDRHTPTPKPSRTVLLSKLTPPPTRSGRLAFLLSCGLLVAFAGIFTLMCAGLVVLGNLAIHPGIALVSMFTAVACATPYFFAILWLDRNDPEPPHLIASAFLWGAILATGLSGIFNDLFGMVALAIVGNEAVASQLTASFSAPLIEEGTKGLALFTLYLFFRRDFDNILDGVFYGAMVGLGFAVFENFVYYANSDTLGQVLLMTMLRGIITGLGTHVSFTAITGASVGMFRVLRRGVLRWFLPPLGLLGAMIAHFSWNTFAQLFSWEDQSWFGFLFVSMPLAVTFLQAPFYLMMLLVSALSLRHERQMIERYLGSEKAPVLLDGELARLVPARWRTWHALKLLSTLQVREWWITRQRNVRLVRLAFEKWHMDQEAIGGDDLEGRAHALAVLALRRELEALKLPSQAK